MAKQPSNLQEKLNWILTITVLVLSFIVPLLLCGLFYLSQVPDITWGGEGRPTYTRIWLHRERRPVGLGYESRRVTLEYNDHEICVQNKLRFLLWGKSAQAEPATTQLKLALINNRWQPTGEPCR
jgi:hypothetical protein